MRYTCKCEDEYFKNNCSQECDLCEYGHTDDEACFCMDCQANLDSMVCKDFVQVIDIHNDSIYLAPEDFKKDTYEFVDGNTLDVRRVNLPICPVCHVQPAKNWLFACNKCTEEN